MTLKDMMKKKNEIESPTRPRSDTTPEIPSITFLRTTTNDQSELDFDPSLEPPPPEPEKHRLFSFGSRRRAHSHSPSPIPSDRASVASTVTGHGDTDSLPEVEGGGLKKRLSTKLHISRSLSRSHSSSRVPSSAAIPNDLPQIAGEEEGPGVAGKKPGEKPIAPYNEHEQAAWEERATILANSNPVISKRRASHPLDDDAVVNETIRATSNGTPSKENYYTLARRETRRRSSSVGSVHNDEKLQKAIELHEQGDLQKSTAMFGTLADPTGANNALAQVLYGLALRHGWGINADPETAVTYLSYAAANSAAIEGVALRHGEKNGGAAKGELVLAIFELANCFRNGWGVKTDHVAARKYYETAANLGDTDAMNEVAFCYLHGVGGKKDKFKAAQYLRLAEEKGSKQVGNSWIWKEKYDPRS